MSGHTLRYYLDFEQSKYLGAIPLEEVIAVNDGNDHNDKRFVFELVTNKRLWIGVDGHNQFKNK